MPIGPTRNNPDRGEVVVPVIKNLVKTISYTTVPLQGNTYLASELFIQPVPEQVIVNIVEINDAKNLVIFYNR
jgi:hypothetical protein